MKREIPAWAAAAIIVGLLLIAGFFVWQRAGQTTSDVVVPKTFGSESNPYGNEGAPTGGNVPRGTASGP
jgi:hypothetical protein